MSKPLHNQCQHCKVEMGYMQFVDDAEERSARGERQAKCPVCGKWQWPDYFFTRTDYAEAADYTEAFEAAVEAGERATRRKKKRKR